MANPGYSAGYDDHYQHPNAPVSIQGLKDNIKEKEERIALLKEIKKDGEERLAAQERDIAKREQEIREMMESFQRQLAKNDAALSDAGMRLHRTDKTIISLNEQHCRGIMALQHLQKNKHIFVAQTKRDVREEMRSEREQRAASAAVSTEQMQAMKSRRKEREQKKALEQQKRMAARHANGGVTNDTSRRTPLGSGSFFSRVSIGGGPGNGTANGGRAGK